MKKSVLLIAVGIFCCMGVSTTAQENVGIGTSSPDPQALVDMVAFDKGLLVPRVDSNTRKGMNNAQTPQSLLVYDTDYDCFFYWKNSINHWLALCGDSIPGGGNNNNNNNNSGNNKTYGCTQTVELTLGDLLGNKSGYVQVTDSCGTQTSTNRAWITGGNYGIGGSDYLGTLDAGADLKFIAGGNGTNNVSMTVLANGQVVVNQGNTPTGHVFSSYASNGTKSIGDTAISGFAIGAKGVGVHGKSSANDGFGVFGIGTTGVGTGGRASGGTGVYGQSDGNGTAVKALMTSGNGWALEASQNGVGGGASIQNTAGSTPAAQVSHGSLGTSIYALRADNDASTIKGAGVAGEGTGCVYHILSNQNGQAVSSGGSFTGQDFGVIGYSHNHTVGATTDFAGGLFVDSSRVGAGSATSVARVGANVNGTMYKVVGNGTASTIVKDQSGKGRVMFCPEAPEVLFEDYGSGTLSNGEAYIQLDAIFANNVAINEQHPLRVLVQVEGDCNGVFVTDKTDKGFRVKELQGGKSNIPFTYKVVANRIDTYEDGVNVSKFQDLRFPDAPGNPNMTSDRFDSNTSGQSRPQLRGN